MISPSSSERICHDIISSSLSIVCSSTVEVNLCLPMRRWVLCLKANSKSDQGRMGWPQEVLAFPSKHLWGSVGLCKALLPELATINTSLTVDSGVSFRVPFRLRHHCHHQKQQLLSGWVHSVSLNERKLPRRPQAISTRKHQALRKARCFSQRPHQMIDQGQEDLRGPRGPLSLGP